MTEGSKAAKKSNETAAAKAISSVGRIDIHGDRLGPIDTNCPTCSGHRHR